MAAALNVQILHTFRAVSNALMRMLCNTLQAALGVPFIYGSLKAADRIVANGRMRFRDHRAMVFLRCNVVESSRRFKSSVSDIPPIAYIRTSKIRFAQLLVVALIFLITCLYVWLVSVGFISV